MAWLLSKVLYSCLNILSVNKNQGLLLYRASVIRESETTQFLIVIKSSEGPTRSDAHMISMLPRQQPVHAWPIEFAPLLKFANDQTLNFKKIIFFYLKLKQLNANPAIVCLSALE